MYKDKNGEIWQNEDEYNNHLVVSKRVYGDKAKRGIKRYYERLRNDRKTT